MSSYRDRLESIETNAEQGWQVGWIRRAVIGLVAGGGAAALGHYFGPAAVAACAGLGAALYALAGNYGR